MWPRLDETEPGASRTHIIEEVRAVTAGEAEAPELVQRIGAGFSVIATIRLAEMDQDDGR